MVGERFQRNENSGDGNLHDDTAVTQAPGTVGAASSSAERCLYLDDPPPTTPFDVVAEHGLLRLRHYRSRDAAKRLPPVLLVCSLFKRPYILDLLSERSIVRNFLRQGLSVYLTDWLPPLSEDAGRGLQAYVCEDLARAVECVRTRERVDRVSLVGCCLGGFLAVIYAALYPRNVKRLVPFALPFESRPPFAPAAAEYLARAYGNVPAWWIRAGMNARVANPLELPAFLAEELDEPELATVGAQSAVQSMLERWFGSDVPFAGRLFCEVMGDAYGDAQFAENRLWVGDRRVALEHIRCPVLNISAERDRIVPPHDNAAFIERVSGREASNLVFPSGHLGLMVSHAAHEKLWPHVGRWLLSDVSRTRTARRTVSNAPLPESRPNSAATGSRS